MRSNQRSAIAAFAVLACAVAVPAWAIIIVTGRTGLFGVTDGQTVRVSVVNTQDSGIIIPCTAVLDPAGNLVVRMEGMPIGPGEGTHFDFDAASLGVVRGTRQQVRVEVEAFPPDPMSPSRRQQPPDPTRPDDVLLTLEVIDTETGRTQFAMPWTLKTSDAQPGARACSGGPVRRGAE